MKKTLITFAVLAALTSALTYAAVSSISKGPLVVVDAGTGAVIQECVPQTIEGCNANIVALGEALGVTKETGSKTYMASQRTRYNFKRNPVVTPPPPATWPQPPMPGMPVVTDGVARYEEGVNELRTASTSDRGYVSGDVGAFRISCRPSHTNFDDAIVYPNDVGRAHNHTNFGNTATSATIDLNNLRTVGASSCAGGSANKSAYWVPSMIDENGRVQRPASIQVYYKSGYAPWRRFDDIRPLPAGLRFIAGYAMDAGGREHDAYKHHFSCDYEGTPAQTAAQTGLTIPRCLGDERPNQFQLGSTLWATLDFPNCWDGARVDSPNHRDHMAYGTPQGCPASHPVLVSTITFNVIWKVGPGQDTRNWKLSDTVAGSVPGYSFHGDWVNGWDPAIENAWLTNCVKASKDCGSNNLGDGRVLTQ